MAEESWKIQASGDALGYQVDPKLGECAERWQLWCGRPTTSDGGEPQRATIAWPRPPPPSIALQQTL
jgi:hypothetical protein